MVKPHELSHRSLTDPLITSNIMRNDNEPIEDSYELIIKISGNIDGILYWYCINYIDDVIIDTYTSSYYNSACFVIDEQCETNHIYKINVKQHKGLLKIHNIPKIC